jgi:hypothetical protein
MAAVLQRNPVRGSGSGHQVWTILHGAGQGGCGAVGEG